MPILFLAIHSNTLANAAQNTGQKQAHGPAYPSSELTGPHPSHDDSHLPLTGVEDLEAFLDPLCCPDASKSM